MTKEFYGGKLWFLFLPAAMGGFLFGHDTAVWASDSRPSWRRFTS